MYLDDVGQIARDLRRRQSLSLNATAKQAGISSGTLSAWENGQSRPRVPELLRLLDALGATPEQRRAALERVDTKGAVLQLQKDEARPSIGGNLLRAMRVRQYLTQEEVASQMGMTQSLLAKWERSEAWPTDERLHRLCWVLKAHPDELTAILSCRFAPPPLTQKQFDYDEMLEQMRELQFSLRRKETASLCDLFALSRLAEYKQRAHFDPAWEDAVNYLEGTYGVLLYNRGRHSEAIGYSDEVLGNVGGDWGKQRLWLDSLMIRVMNGANAKGNKARSTLSLIHTSLPHVKDYQYRSWLISEMAYALISVGEGVQAFHASERGLREAEESGFLEEVKNRRSDSLNILIASGNVTGITRYLNLYGTELLELGENPSTRVVSVVKALLTVGDGTSATRVRQRVDTWLTSLNAQHLVPDWDTIFSTTPNKSILHKTKKVLVSA